MALSQAFLWVKHKYSLLGKSMTCSLFYGTEYNGYTSQSSVNSVPPLIFAYLDDPQSGYPLTSTFRETLPVDAIYLGVDVLFKGDVGTTPAVAQLAFSASGTRGITASELMPRQTTISCYAKAKQYNVSGARFALSGGFESDQADGIWAVGTGSYIEAVNAFIENWELSESWVSVANTVGFLPAVVKRIPYTTPSGKAANRLPLLSSDIPQVTEVERFQPSRVVSGNNARKPKLR